MSHDFKPSRKNATMPQQGLMDIAYASAGKEFLSTTIPIPRCSIEALGFMYVDNKDLTPFHLSQRKIGPAVGTSELRIHKPVDATIKCYHRGLYENWRPETGCSCILGWLQYYIYDCFGYL